MTLKLRSRKGEEFEKRKKSEKKRNVKKSRKRSKMNPWILKSLKMTARMTLKLRSRKKWTTLLTTKRRMHLSVKKVKVGNGNLTKKNLLLMTVMKTFRPNPILRKKRNLNPKRAKSERSPSLKRKRTSNLPRSPKNLRPRKSSKNLLPNPKTRPKSNKKYQVQLKKVVKLRKKKKKLRFGNGGKRMKRKKMTVVNGISWNIRVLFLLQPTNHCPKLSAFTMMAKKCIYLKMQRRWQVSTVECLIMTTLPKKPSTKTFSDVGAK